MILRMTRTIHYCNFCDYKSDRRYDRDKHVSRKHANDHSTPSQAGSGAVQSVQPHSQMHSNLQEENVDQLHENIEQYQRLQQEEKVTTCDDGRPSHVSIQLFDKYCKGLTDYMHYCKGLINLCQRVHTEKEQQLDRFCTAWEDLKWERDTFANEINRRDCCGEGVIDEKCARKLREKMLRDPNRKKC